MSYVNREKQLFCKTRNDFRSMLQELKMLGNIKVRPMESKMIKCNEPDAVQIITRYAWHFLCLRVTIYSHELISIFAC